MRAGTSGIPKPSGAEPAEVRGPEECGGVSHAGRFAVLVVALKSMSVIPKFLTPDGTGKLCGSGPRTPSALSAGVPSLVPPSVCLYLGWATLAGIWQGAWCNLRWFLLESSVTADARPSWLT